MQRFLNQWTWIAVLIHRRNDFKRYGRKCLLSLVRVRQHGIYLAWSFHGDNWDGRWLFFLILGSLKKEEPSFLFNHNYLSNMWKRWENGFGGYGWGILCFVMVMELCGFLFNHRTDAVFVELRARESVFVVSSVRGLHSCRNGDLTKLERYHNRRPWFYRDINNFGLGSSSMMLSSVCVRPNWFHHHYLFES